MAFHNSLWDPLVKVMVPTIWDQHRWWIRWSLLDPSPKALMLSGSTKQRSSRARLHFQSVAQHWRCTKQQSDDAATCYTKLSILGVFPPESINFTTYYPSVSIKHHAPTHIISHCHQNFPVARPPKAALFACTHSRTWPCHHGGQHGPAD